MLVRAALHLRKGLPIVDIETLSHDYGLAWRRTQCVDPVA